jgi:ABC-type lipoprotein export system ATPase subunit
MTTNPTLADLADRATASRDRPAYGHDALITCDRLVRIFSADGIEVQALQGLDLLVREGELMALVGASGSGKSTLMNILAGLDTPTAGAARVAGRDLLTMTAKDRLSYRREVVGFVWQQTARNLLPYLTAAQNVALPVQLAGTRGRGRAARRARSERALELLELLEVADCRDRRPHQMSGGQQQRVAIAVALANDPAVLLADEPTGELDSHTAEQIFAAFRTANERLGTTIVIVTHDQAVAGEVRRTVAIRDGRTSTEVLRRSEVDATTGHETVVAREYAMLDRAGRLQLPACTRRAAGDDRPRDGGGPRVRHARPRRPSPAARRVHAGPRHARPRRPGTGARPHRRTAGRQRAPLTPRTAQRTLRPSAPVPARRRATDPYGVRSRSHAPEETSAGPSPAAFAGRRKPSDWAACTARTGSPVSPTVRDHISRPIRSSSARVRFSGASSPVRDRNSATAAETSARSASGAGRPGSGRQPPRGGSTPAHGGPVTAPGTVAVAAGSSTDSRSSPADTVTSSVTSSPFSYGFASRTARTASTSKEGGRPKTASAVPCAWRRTAAPRS